MTKPLSSYKSTGRLAELLFRFHKGPRRTCRWLVDRLRDRQLDRAFGILSSPPPEIRKLPPSAEFVRYQAVSYSDMREVIELLAIGPSEVFLDYGSGMGRAVCLAATYPFRTVIGIEISRDLCALANHNLNKVRDKLQCRDVRFLEKNAQEYKIPEAVTIFFFFNPFRGSVLTEVLDNIARSVREAPRKVRVVFYGTVSTRHFRIHAARHGWLKLASETVLRTGAVVLIYVNTNSNIC